ncbi:acid-sensing ion channel 4-like [Amphibalanus amphitrite]|uniref:acid-sensing ion channel 4-like n=1 Tax=Amphibalanus amphitrite TaxID=1232801 RepID=UPI001C924405|nr:acid-sensing ion channel 4-like [Amphibalanus amphitrite]
MGAAGPRSPSGGLQYSMQEFCRTSSAHGLGHLPNSSGRARYTWLLIVLVLLVALVYNVSVSIYREVVVQPIRTENTWVTTSEPMPLPRTTLCDLSVFRQPRLDARNVSRELASYLASSLGGEAFTAPWFLEDAERQSRLEAEYESILEPGENYTDLIDSLSPSCSDVIKSCQLATIAVPGEECCQKYFTAVYTIRGKCFQMADFTQEADGKQHGLLFTLSLPPAEFPTLDRSLVGGCLNTRLGMEILLDDPHRLPHVRVYTHSVAVSAPGVLELRVTRETSDRHGLLNSVFPPRHRCAASNGTSLPESVDNCPVLQLAETIRLTCGCYWLSLPVTTNDTGTPICSPLQAFSCAIPLQMNQSRTGCHSACREDDFQTDVIVNKLSPMAEAIGMRRGVPPDGLLFLKVYFKTLQYRLVRHWCQTGSELLAELGGHMGIFLGVSVVTLCEAVAAIGSCVAGVCRARRVDSDEDVRQRQADSGERGAEPWGTKTHAMPVAFRAYSPSGELVPMAAAYYPPPPEKIVRSSLQN